MLDIVPRSLEQEMSSLMRSAKDWTPWPYQGLGLKYLLKDPFCGLLLDPGMGKTSITLAAITILLKKRLIKRALVVAPLRAIYEVWPQEKSEWKDFHHLNMALLHGSDKDYVLRNLEPHHQICLINPEGFEWLCESNRKFKLLGADHLVIDESSKWKNSQSVRFKKLKKHLWRFDRRNILTGSPRPKNYQDLFSQIYILDRGRALGSFITHFRQKYFFQTGFAMREWELLDGADKKIDKLVAPMVMRLDALDHLKLPATPERTHKVLLPPKVQVEYDRIEETLMSTLFDQPLTNSAAARAKCCQIANGGVYTDLPTEERWRRDRPFKLLHSAKVEALADLYEELQGQPLLVGIGYHHDVVAIEKALGRKLPVLNSKTTKTQFNDYIRKWNAGELDLLLGHPASMGHALNMQKSNGRHVAFFDIPDDYDNFDQMFRRVWRQGNKAPFCMKHLFVTQNTVDVAKMSNLERKGTGQNAFLKAMKEYTNSKYNKGRRKVS